MPYEVKAKGNQYCVYKKGEGDSLHCYDTKAEAEKYMEALYANVKEKMSMYLIDDFVTVRPGLPFRLFPFGRVIKNGIAHDITPEYAAMFKLPHFKPPVKLGSHEDVTPAGGFLTQLEVRPDGLYAMPEWNEAGVTAMKDGAYRYQSPEVIWSDGALENPSTGQSIPGPLIVGCALLHTPHLGEAAALYSIEPHKLEKGDTTMADTLQAPEGFWNGLADKFAALFPKQPEIKPDDFAAATKERDELKAELSKIQTAQKLAVEKTALIAELQNKEKFGMTYIELKAADEAAAMLAGMTPEQRDWCTKNFSALAMQVKESNLTGEHGSNAAVKTGREAFEAAIVEKQAKGMNYVQAFDAVRAEHPELLKEQ